MRLRVMSNEEEEEDGDKKDNGNLMRIKCSNVEQKYNKKNRGEKEKVVLIEIEKNQGNVV